MAKTKKAKKPVAKIVGGRPDDRNPPPKPAKAARRGK